jgi:hypothetical protein
MPNRNWRGGSRRSDKRQGVYCNVEMCSEACGLANVKMWKWDRLALLTTSSNAL